MDSHDVSCLEGVGPWKFLVPLCADKLYHIAFYCYSYYIHGITLYQHVALAMILNIFGSDQLVWTPNCFNFATFSSMKPMTW